MQEKQKLGKDVGKLRSSLVDVKSNLASTSAEKERFFQEKLELHQRINSLSCDRDSLLKVSNFMSLERV